MRTIFFGSGAFALPILERLLASELADVSLVVTAPASAAGRRGGLRSTPVAVLASEQGLAVSTPMRLRDPETLASLRAQRADLVVLADYGRIIPVDVLEMPRHGALNLHPSLLPRHRGAAPVPAAILAGDTTTGVTLMRMDAGLDSGPIVAQQRLQLEGDEDAPDLEARLAAMGAELLISSLPAWLDGSLQATPQPDDGVTMTRPLRRSDGLLDPQRSAAELERQVRAYRPWPGSYLEVDGDRLIVWAAEVEAVTVADAGSGTATEKLGLDTVSGRLVLTEVQPAGKRRMGAAEYLRGKRR